MLRNGQYSTTHERNPEHSFPQRVVRSVLFRVVLKGLHHFPSAKVGSRGAEREKIWWVPVRSLSNS